MATLTIDDETFQAWSRQATACGLTVEEWLKMATTGTVPRDAGLSAEERLRRFDELVREMTEMKISSGGHLDDSRETIYGDRGL